MKLFLDSAGLDRKVATFENKATVFAQGDAAKKFQYDGGIHINKSLLSVVRHD
ncbi:MAG: hypothetical protein WA211_11785 [Candidatus Acidiferrales bacterium]